jgi:uncharacterized protein (DUF488 family)
VVAVKNDAKVWTVGTGHRELAELVGLLQGHGIGRVIDVRSYPKSHLLHYCREAFATGLDEHGIGYLWLGNDLGGLRKQGYEAYMQTPRFATGLDRLTALAGETPSAICCAEIDPERCHRRLIADALVDWGWQVLHIIDRDRVRRHWSQPRQPVLPFD